MRPIECLTEKQRQLYSSYISRRRLKLPVTEEMRIAKNLYNKAYDGLGKGKRR
jgi:hypothetical protein